MNRWPSLCELLTVTDWVAGFDPLSVAHVPGVSPAPGQALACRRPSVTVGEWVTARVSQTLGDALCVWLWAGPVTPRLISSSLSSVPRNLGSWATLPWALSSLGPSQPTPSLGSCLQVMPTPSSPSLWASSHFPFLLLPGCGTFPVVQLWASDLTCLSPSLSVEHMVPTSLGSHGCPGS